MDWLFKIVRIAGASFPVAASLVQLQAEIDAKSLSERVSRLEDPISSLHQDVPEVSRRIYTALKNAEDFPLEFDDAFYGAFARALAALEAERFLEPHHTIGKEYAGGLSVSDPTFVMYMCALAEDRQKMEALISIVDGCAVGQWLDGREIRKTLDLPIPVIKAVFEIFERKGYGVCSPEIGACTYLGNA